MIDRRRVCFSAFVFGDYYNFIPFFIYSVKKKYPGVGIKLFFYDQNKNIYNQKLRNFNSNDVEIVYLPNVPIVFRENNGAKPISKAQMLKSQRWLLKSDYFKDYDYVYVSDVDILFSGNKDLLKSFQENFELYQLPFSNKVRFRDNYNQIRLTGLQFMKLKEYFEIIDQYIDRFRENTEYRKHLLNNVTGNEHLLYNLVLDAFHFNPDELRNAQRWHGGINMGGGLKPNKKEFIELILLETGCSREELTHDLKTYSNDPVFLNYVNAFFSLPTYQIFKWFGINLFSNLTLTNKIKVIYQYNIILSLKIATRFCMRK